METIVTLAICAEPRPAARPVSGRNAERHASTPRGAIRCCSGRRPPTAFPPAVSPPATRVARLTELRAARAKSNSARGQLPACPTPCALPPMPIRSAGGPTSALRAGPRPARRRRPPIRRELTAVRATTREPAGRQSVGANAAGRAARHGELPRQIRQRADVGALRGLRSARQSVGIGTTLPLDSLHVRASPTPTGSLHGLRRPGISATPPRPTPGIALLRPERRPRPVPGFQQRHPRIPHQQHRQERRRLLQRLDQLHDRRARRRFFVSPISVGVGATSPSPSFETLDVSSAISGSGVDEHQRDVMRRQWVQKTNRDPERRPGAQQRRRRRRSLGWRRSPDPEWDWLRRNGFRRRRNSAVITMRASGELDGYRAGVVYEPYSTTANGSTPARSPGWTIEFECGRVGDGRTTAPRPPGGEQLQRPRGQGWFARRPARVLRAPRCSSAGRHAGRGLAPSQRAESGDTLAGYPRAQGYGATGFGGTRAAAACSLIAAENWSDAAQGASLGLPHDGDRHEVRPARR